MHHARIIAGALLVGAASAACRERPADQPRSAVARYGNRIAKGRFRSTAGTCHLPTNNGPNRLHGGVNASIRLCGAARPIDRNGVVGVAYQSNTVFAFGVAK